MPVMPLFNIVMNLLASACSNQFNHTVINLLTILKAYWGMKVTTHLHLAPRLRACGAVPPLLHMS